MTIVAALSFGMLAGWFVPSIVSSWVDPEVASRRATAMIFGAYAAATLTVPHPDAVLAVGFWCLCLAVVDSRCRRLPNALTLPGAAAVFVAAAYDGAVGRAVAGGLGLVLVYSATYALTRGGIGAGDVKLALPLGALAATSGATAWWAAAMSAQLITAVLAVITGSAGRRAGRRDRSVPHGPSMCVATLLAWVVGAT